MKLLKSLTIAGLALVGLFGFNQIVNASSHITSWTDLTNQFQDYASNSPAKLIFKKASNGYTNYIPVNFVNSWNDTYSSTAGIKKMSSATDECQENTTGIWTNSNSGLKWYDLNGNIDHSYGYHDFDASDHGVGYYCIKFTITGHYNQNNQFQDIEPNIVIMAVYNHNKPTNTTPPVDNNPPVDDYQPPALGTPTITNGVWSITASGSLTELKYSFLASQPSACNTSVGTWINVDVNNPTINVIIDATTTKWICIQASATNSNNQTDTAENWYKICQVDNTGVCPGMPTDPPRTSPVNQTPTDTSTNPDIQRQINELKALIKTLIAQITKLLAAKLR